MREYDENVRLYTPILQRIIILVAVIIAVPVVLWTITAFVRAYVAQPRPPTFRPIAANTAASEAPASQAPAAQTSSGIQVAAQAVSTATDTRTTLLDIKKPAASAAPQAASTMPAASMPASTMATPTVAAPALPAAAMSAASAPPASPQVQQAAAALAASVATPAGAAPPPAAAAAAPANVALANVAPPPNAATIAPAVSAPDSQPAATVVAPSEQAAANDAAADDLPAGTPLTGKIPLPHRRPNVPAMTSAMTAAGEHPAATNTAAHVALAGIPLPRARPASAPEPPPVADPPYPVYDMSQIH